MLRTYCYTHCASNAHGHVLTASNTGLSPVTHANLSEHQCDSSAHSSTTSASAAATVVRTHNCNTTQQQQSIASVMHHTPHTIGVCTRTVRLVPTTTPHSFTTPQSHCLSSLTHLFKYKAIMMCSKHCPKWCNSHSLHTNTVPTTPQGSPQIHHPSSATLQGWGPGRKINKKDRGCHLPDV